MKKPPGVPPIFPPVASATSTMMQLHQMSRGASSMVPSSRDSRASYSSRRTTGEKSSSGSGHSPSLTSARPGTSKAAGTATASSNENGAFFMSVRKHDARVLDFGCWAIVHPPPEVQAIVNAELQRRKDEGER